MVAKLTTPDPTSYLIPGYNSQATFHDYLAVLYRNSLVLALHAMACVAGFMAGSSLPLPASKRSGVSRWVHEKAGPLAIGFVVCATTFSLCTQAYVIGGGAAAIAAQLGTSPGMLLLALGRTPCPSCSRCSCRWRHGSSPAGPAQWQDLLAATFVTVAISVPILLAARRDRDLGLAAPAGRGRAVGAARRPTPSMLLRVRRRSPWHLWPVSSTNVTRTVRVLPLRPTTEANPTFAFLPLTLTLPVFLSTCEITSITELSTPGRRVHEVVRHPEAQLGLGMPSIFTSKIGAASAP